MPSSSWVRVSILAFKIDDSARSVRERQIEARERNARDMEACGEKYIVLLQFHMHIEQIWNKT